MWETVTEWQKQQLGSNGEYKIKIAKYNKKVFEIILSHQHFDCKKIGMILITKGTISRKVKCTQLPKLLQIYWKQSKY